MRKKTIGILFVLSIVLWIAGAGLWIGTLITSPSVYDPDTGVHHITSIGNLPLFALGLIIYVLGFASYVIAWIGALVNLARLQQWIWFVLMFIFSGICLIVYLFAGPETPKVVQYPQYASRPDQQHQQPSQNYPS